MYNGGFELLTFVIHKNRADVSQNLQNLSYEAYSTDIATIFRNQIIHSGFQHMRHYTSAACCYVTKIYDILPQWNGYDGNQKDL